MFDAASWNGIAIDSTCGGHGTCKKCKVKVRRRAAPPTPLDTRAFTPSSCGGAGARLPGAGHRRRQGGGAAADHPAKGGHRRGRPAGDLAPGGAKALPGAGRADPGRPGDRPERLLAAMDDLELRVDARAPELGRVLRAADYKVTAVVVDDELIGVSPGTPRPGGSASPTTWAPPPWSPPCWTCPPAHQSRWLGAQHAAAVRRRRHHPDQRHHAGPEALGRLTALAQRPCPSWPPGVRRGGVDRRRSTRSPSPATRP